MTSKIIIGLIGVLVFFTCQSKGAETDTIPHINLITADKMNTITDIDKNFEKFDIEWLVKNATAKYPMGKIFSYEYKKKDNFSIYMGGDESGGYYYLKFFNDSYFSIVKEYYPNGNIKEKGWHFNQQNTNGFKKGIWYYFNESGELINEINHDEPFKFTAEDVFRFCEKEHIVLEKGDKPYAEYGFHTEIRKELKYNDYKNCVWIIRRQINGGENEQIVLDGISGKVLSRKNIYLSE